jgi:ketosteroid isomerase-like protein
MKLITSFCAAAALTFSLSAFAQEDSPSPAPTPEEKASASVEATSESTPEAKPSPSATEKSATSTTAKKKDEATTTSGSEKKEGSAETASKKTTEPAVAAKPGKKMSPEATVKDMENRWEASVPGHDASTIQAFVASDFAGISSKGKFSNRTSILSELKKDTDTYKSAKNEKLNVRVYGPNVAVATGAAREKGTGKDGKVFDRKYLFTDTWVERNGAWQCVASQVALLSGK